MRTTVAWAAPALAASLALAGCGTGTSAAPGASASSAPNPTTFTVSGSVTVVGASYADSAVSGEACAISTHDESGLTPGTQVVLSNDAGRTLALGNLATEGRFTSSSTTKGWYAPCAFGFTFTNVPEGEAFYTISAGEHGEMKFSRDALDSPVELALG